MRIGIPTENRSGESRVAATPETVKKLAGSGQHQIMVQSGAGAGAFFPDSEYTSAGASIVPSASEIYQQSDIVLKVRGPEDGELAQFRPGSILIGLLAPHDKKNVDALANQKITAFAMEWLPRITRAQNMDVLSSQANIAGYKAVMMAAEHYQRFFPMLMTAAGTVKAARMLIMGAGVAGLQAIATAKRLGAVIEVFDVRPAVKEQVESLGGKFVEVPVSEAEKSQAETAGGYAREMSDEYKARQAQLIHERAKAADIIITTALIPGKPAPILIKEETVRAMKPGSIIVDLAVEAGGNCPLSEYDKIVTKHNVTLIGIANLPSRVAADASALYARNLLNFINLLVDPKTGELKLNRDDEIIAGSLVAIDGQAAPRPGA